MSANKPKSSSTQPLIAHVVFRFGYGGLENGIVNLINATKGGQSRHCVNGVDTGRFHPRRNSARYKDIVDRFPLDSVVIGSVLRFQDIKDPMNLVQAFISARPRAAESGIKLCLVMIGGGPLRQHVIDALYGVGMASATWLPGSREDIPEITRSLDVFVFGSGREGISNALLEAMASGLPIVATRTRGNTELIRPGETGALVAPEDSQALAEGILKYDQDGHLRESHAASAREVASAEHSLDTMTRYYESVYRRAIGGSLESRNKRGLA